MLMCRIARFAGVAALVLVSAATSAEQRHDEVTVVPDARTVIALSEAERAFIKREMRGLLESVHEILLASSVGDRAAIAAAGRRAGMNGPEKDHIPPALAPKLPPEFKKLGLAAHRAFDQIALEAEQGGATATVPKQIGELMGNCVACHSTWRAVDEVKR